jgi:hypothetical protein
LARFSVRLEISVKVELGLGLEDAQQQNMTCASIQFVSLINHDTISGQFFANNNTNHNPKLPQLPVSLQHLNQIAVVSFPGEVVNLMRGQGSMSQRLVASTPLVERGNIHELC